MDFTALDLDYNEPATTDQKFLALQGTPIEERGFGVVTFYAGTAQTDVASICEGDSLEFTRKEFAMYQEFLINEDSIWSY